MVSAACRALDPLTVRRRLVDQRTLSLSPPMHGVVSVFRAATYGQCLRCGCLQGQSTLKRDCESIHTRHNGGAEPQTSMEVSDTPSPTHPAYPEALDQCLFPRSIFAASHLALDDCLNTANARLYTVVILKYHD